MGSQTRVSRPSVLCSLCHSAGGSDAVWVLGFSALLSHPTYVLQCPRLLQEEEFLKVLRSTFPQLAPDKPFKVFKIGDDRTLQPLPIQTLTPQEVCRLGGAATICIRLQVSAVFPACPAGLKLSVKKWRNQRKGQVLTVMRIHLYSSRIR